MTKDQAIKNELNSATRDGDLEKVRTMITSNDELRKAAVPTYGTLLHLAANKGQLEIVRYLIGLGADINERSGLAHATPLYEAASNCQVDVVKYLLAIGAEIDVSEPERNPLFAAIQERCSTVAKLLIESGMDLRVEYSGENMNEMDALAFAREWGQNEIVDLLIKSGCEDTAKSGRHPTPPHPAMAHIIAHFGTPLPIALGQILPSPVPVSVHVVQKDNALVLVTTGMSDVELTVPSGRELYKFAELVMILPPDWPHGPEALTQPEYSWPYQWMQRVAAFPHESQTWLRPAVIIDCDGPLALNTALRALLVYSEDSASGRAELADERTVMFYFVIPIYREERDFGRQAGIPALFERLRQRGFHKNMAVNRPNVAMNR